MRFTTLSLLIWCGLAVTSVKIGLAQMKEPDKELIETHLKKIVGERTYGLSDKHLEEVFHYVRVSLQNLGYQIELDPFTYNGGTFHNIIARKKGEKSDERIIVGAHF